MIITFRVIEHQPVNKTNKVMSESAVDNPRGFIYLLEEIKSIDDDHTMTYQIAGAKKELNASSRLPSDLQESWNDP